MAVRVSFVGAGPGAADLITIRGARLLRHADVVIFAGSLVDRELVRRYATKADVYDSAGMTLTEVITVMMDAIVAGQERGAPAYRRPVDLWSDSGTDGGSRPDSGSSIRSFQA